MKYDKNHALLECSIPGVPSTLPQLCQVVPSSVTVAVSGSAAGIFIIVVRLVVSSSWVNQLKSLSALWLPKLLIELFVMIALS